MRTPLIDRRDFMKRATAAGITATLAAQAVARFDAVSAQDADGAKLYAVGRGGLQLELRGKPVTVTYLVALEVSNPGGTITTSRVFNLGTGGGIYTANSNLSLTSGSRQLRQVFPAHLVLGGWVCFLCVLTTGTGVRPAQARGSPLALLETKRNTRSPPGLLARHSPSVPGTPCRPQTTGRSFRGNVSSIRIRPPGLVCCGFT